MVCRSSKRGIECQCSKLGFKFVHPPGAEDKLRYTLNIRGNGAHAGCTSFNIVHPALESCTQGAGCTLNFEH